MMKSTISLHQPSTKASLSDRLADWLESDNNLLSSIMEESVSNRQALLFLNALIPFVLICACVFVDITVTIAIVAYFAFALHLCEKGGMK